MCGDPGLLVLILLVLLLGVASLPAGSVVLASALAPVAIVGGIALEYGLVDPRIIPAFGLLAVPGLILGLRTARKYPKQHLRQRLLISAILTVMFSSVISVVYAFKGVVGPTSFDFPRHASLALSLLTTGKPPVFYDTLRQEYRPVHYPSGLGHTAVVEPLIYCALKPEDLKDAASWRVQFGSVLLEDLVYYVDAAMIASAVVDMLIVARGPMPLSVVLPLALSVYLTCSEPCFRLVPFFQSLAVLAASGVALIVGSRLLSAFLALGAVVLHFYSVVITALTVPALLRTGRVRVAVPVLIGVAVGAVIQYPYVHWSTMTYFPRYPAHPEHLPPDRVLGPIACALQLPFTALTGSPPNILLDAWKTLLLLPLTLVIGTVLVRYRGFLPLELRTTWVTVVVAVLALGAVSELVGGRLLFVTPILTTASLAVAAVDYPPALGMLYFYCALTAHWWWVFGSKIITVDELREHWRIFHKALEGREIVATVPEGRIPFTTTWKPEAVARVVRTFPSPRTPLLVTAQEDFARRFLPPVPVDENGYVVRKLPPLGIVWVADDRVGSFRGNVFICADRYGPWALIRITVFDYSWTGSPDVVMLARIRGNRVSLLEPTGFAVFGLLETVRAHRVGDGFLIRVWFPYGVRVLKVTVRGAKWAGGELVFRGSLKDLIANLRITGDLV